MTTSDKWLLSLPHVKIIEALPSYMPRGYTVVGVMSSPLDAAAHLCAHQDTSGFVFWPHAMPLAIRS